MAKKKNDAGKNKNKKPSSGSKFKNFFKSLNGELKKVVWPDKKTVWQTTGVVLVIVLIVTIIVYAIDSLMVFILGKLGFNVASSNDFSTSTTTTITTSVETEESSVSTESTIEISSAASETEKDKK